MADEPPLARIASFLINHADDDTVELPGPSGLPRAVVLVAGLMVDERLRHYVEYAVRRGLQIVGMTASLSAAAGMVEAGEAEVILMESRGDLPASLESTTYGEITRPPSPKSSPPGQRRQRPQRRYEGRSGGG